MTPRILIIGGGIGGLALAHGLKRRNIPFHVYERDATSSHRAQGYRIRVAGPAVASLQYLFDDRVWGLFELTAAEMRLGPISKVDAESAKVSELTMPHGRTAPPTHQGGKPFTVDRTMFREVLLTGVAEHISFGKAFERYTEQDGGIVAHFTDGSTAKGSLLIGCDGARSAVRQQYLPHHRILDTRGRCVYGKTILTDALRASLEPAVMRRMSAIKDRSRTQLVSMILEPITFPRRVAMRQQGFDCPDDYIYWVLATQPEVLGLKPDEMSQISGTEAEELALRITDQWHPTLKPIVEQQARGQTAVLPIRSCPPDLGYWEPNEHITLLGDAVHCMAPTAGSGAITALRDAHLLCRLLVEEGLSEDVIGRYESQMREYASETIELSWQAGERIFGQKRTDVGALPS